MVSHAENVVKLVSRRKREVGGGGRRAHTLARCAQGGLDDKSSKRLDFSLAKLSEKGPLKILQLLLSNRQKKRGVGRFR